MSDTAKFLTLMQRALARKDDRIVDLFRAHYEQRARQLGARLIAGDHA